MLSFVPFCCFKNLAHSNEVAYQLNMLIHCAILCKEILKIVFKSFYVSIQGSTDCIKNYIFLSFI